MAVFAFKDFVVHQDNSPLKVNTDAILLGASIPRIPEHAKVLDVGTGNGTIALLLALRFPTASILGIDPHLGAFSDAQLNFQQAAFLAQTPVEKCIVIEDSTNGIIAAKAAGIYCIGYDSVHSKLQDYSLADEVISHFNELSFEKIIGIG